MSPDMGVGSTETRESAYLDTLDPMFRPDSAEVREARAVNWYARTPLGYAVLRYEPATELLADRRLRHGLKDFLATQGVTEGPLYDWMRQGLLSVEGADHTRLRRLVSKAFTRSAVDALRPAMREITHELVGRFHAAGRCEFMADFADPYPARVICELLGVPAEQHEAFRGWANDLGLAFSTAVATHRERIEAALAGLYEAVDTLLAQRRTDPRPDLLSALIAAEEAGDRLSPEELRVMVALLLFAGQDTTRHQLGQAMTTFMTHLDQWSLLAERPELAPRAVEEVMRLAPTVPTTPRIAVESFTYRGLAIPAGTLLAALLASANTDPDAFAPGGFDITQPRSTQLTFGGGVHYCLGAALARAEMAEALPILADRLRAPESDGQAAWRPTMGITGPTTLPIRFSP